MNNRRGKFDTKYVVGEQNVLGRHHLGRTEGISEEGKRVHFLPL